MEWQAVEVKSAVTMFYQCLSFGTSLLNEKLKQQAVVPINIRGSDFVYFEPESLRVFRAIYSLPEFSALTSTGIKLCFKPFLYEFPYGIAILTLKCEPSSPDGKMLFPHILHFNEAYRYTKLRAFQQSFREQYGLHQCSEYPQGVPLPGQPVMIAEVLERIRNFFLPPETTDIFPTFGKMMVGSFLNLLESLSDADRYHLMCVDKPPPEKGGPSDPLPAPEFVAQQEQYIYRRWVHQGQYFGYTGHSFIMWLEPSPVPRLSEHELLAHWENLYARIHLLLIFQRAALSLFSRRLARVEEDWRSYPHRSEKEVARLRREMLEFTNRSWFARITYEIQGTELFKLGSRAMDIENLYTEVREKLKEFDEYLSGWRQGRVNRSVAVLQFVLTPVIVLGVLVSGLQIQGVRDFYMHYVPDPVWQVIDLFVMALILSLPVMLVLRRGGHE